MRRRLAVATAGVIVIAAAVLAFSLSKHPVVVGTNTAAPFLPAMAIHGGETRCQPIAKVPPGASHVRVVLSEIEGAPGQLRLAIRGSAGEVITAGHGRVGLAGQVIRLRAPTRLAHPGRVCMRYSGSGHIVLAGERKRVPVSPALLGPRKRGVASLVFLRPGLATWASRRDQIVERYANSQTGPFGEWSLWLAVIAAIAAAALGYWWIVFRSSE